MNIKEQMEDLLLLGKETVLSIMKLADDEIKKAKANEDYEKEKSILLEVIPKYQRLFIEFDREVDDEEIKEDILGKLEEIVYKLIEDYQLDEEEIWDKVRLRLKYKGNSGGEVVKNLYEYQLKELKSDKNKLLDIEKRLLIKQRELEKKLADCIQEDEELEAFVELKENASKLDKIEKKFIELEENISELQYNIDSKWRYEIYGTLSKEEMLEAYKEVNR
jgi:hypothetical protein